MTSVFWYSGVGGHAFRLNNDIGMAHGTGVYIIWRPGTLLSIPRTIRVGSGVIQDRLRAHKADPQITYFGLHELRFTYCNPSVLLIPGVERYVAEQLRPEVGSRFPDVRPVWVNLPALTG